MALAQAAEAAARQGAFWAFHDALYADQGRIDDPHLWARVRGARASTSSASRPTAATAAIVERVRARRPRRAARWGDDDADPVRMALGPVTERRARALRRRVAAGARNAPDARLIGFGFR